MTDGLRNRAHSPARGFDGIGNVGAAVAKMITGLRPRGFTWVISDRLAVSERIGGIGFQHRKVRREEEITWLVEEAGITAVVSLLSGNQNLSSYTEAGLATFSAPIQGAIVRSSRRPVFAAIDQALESSVARVLVHREVIDDGIAGLLGGYLVESGLVTDPVLAAAVIQEILGRAIGPAGRSLIPADE